MNSILQLIDQAHSSCLGTAAAWLREGELEVFCRVQRMPIGTPDQGYPTVLNIANIKSEVHGRGRLNALLNDLESNVGAKGIDGIVVEHVHNERLRGFLEHRGYRTVKLDGHEHTFYRELP